MRIGIGLLVAALLTLGTWAAPRFFIQPPAQATPVTLTQGAAPERGCLTLEEYQAVRTLEAHAEVQVEVQGIYYERLHRVHEAMEAVAETKWPHDLQKLMRRWRQPYSSWDFAEMFLKHADANGIDPLVLVAITWQESKFKAVVKGDHLRGKARSCGCTQVRTDIRGRPKCTQLLDPDFAIGWTAKHLAGFVRRCKGKLCLNKYNRGEYEVKVWRTVDLMRRALL